MITSVTVNKKGQVLIPKDVREALGIVEGDMVQIDVTVAKKKEGPYHAG